MFTNYIFLLTIISICTFLIQCSFSPVFSQAENENSSPEEAKDEVDLSVSETSENESSDHHQVESEQSLKTVLQLYDRIFAQDQEGMKNLLSDDFIMIHRGPLNPDLPFYNIYHGKEGFIEWINNIFTPLNLYQYEPQYYISDGNKVDVHVREGSIIYKSNASHSIENHHAYKLNKEGKIEYAKIISDPLPVVNSLYGQPGEHFESHYKKEVITAENYGFDINYNKKLAKKALECIVDGKSEKLMEFLADDAVFVINGDENVVPFTGKFSGKEEISSFVEKFSAEVDDVEIDYSIAQGNKADIFFLLDLESTTTERELSRDALLALQFDKDGKIVFLYSHTETYEIQQLYLP